MKKKIGITGIYIGLLALFVGGQAYGQSLSVGYSPSSQSYGTGASVGTVSPAVSGGPASGGGQTTSNFVSSGLYNPLNTAVDALGNVYIADSDNNQIKKVTPSGTVTVLAGSGGAGSDDGTGSSASFQHPSALAVDASGNVFVSDQQNHKIRKITPSGVVSTFAGSGSPGFANGTGTGASFSSPIGLAFDSSGNLYVADYSNNRIRVISPSGVVGTFAGTGVAGSTNGSALSATFRNPMGVAVDAAGNVYVADRLNHMIRKISSGTVSTVAGNGSMGSASGYGISATFQYPNNLALDAAGNIYVADQQNHMIRKIDGSGYVSAFAGTTAAGTVNGTGSGVRLNSPYGLSIDKQGTLYVAETGSFYIRKIVTSAFVVVPQLPKGLSFNNSNGNITGSPMLPSASTVYYITAYNTTYSSTPFALNITVTGAGIAEVQPSSDRNFVMETVVREEGVTTLPQLSGLSVSQANRSISYFDGLGRPLQTVQVQASPDGKDIVQPLAYDAYGRQAVSYLPYASRTESSGGYKADALAQQVNYYTAPNGSTTGWDANVVKTPSPYGVTVFEPSPLNRVTEQGAPGTAWQPSVSRSATTGRTVLNTFGSNNSLTTYSTTGFSVRQYSASPVAVAGREHERILGGTGYYGAGQLYLCIVKDENWTDGNGKTGTMEEYKDKEGKVVLKRTFNQVGATVEVLSTYYVYDDLGNLSFVLPPGSAPDAAAVPVQSVLDNFCYQYRYDGRKRLIEKKIPGKGWEYMVYNKLDQVVASQDALQRGKAPQDFSISKYDALGRVVMTGIYSHPSSAANTSYRAALETAVNAQTVLWEVRIATGTGYSNLSWPTSGVSTTLSLDYYDNYAVPGLPASAPYNLSASYNTNTKSLPTVSLVNVLGTTQMLWRVNYYDADWRLARVVTQHYKNGATTVNNYDDVSSSYNFAGQVTSTGRRHYVNGTEALYVTNRFIYDQVGRLKDSYQKIGDNISTANAEILLSRKNYNGIGQLSSKQLHSINTGTSFAQTVTFGYNARGWLKNQSAPLFSQTLKYEDIISGVTPQYNGNISRQEWGSSKFYNYTYDRLNRLSSAVSSDSYNEKSVRYDVMGNITGLQRSAGSTAFVDQLKYTYTGNQLSSVLDSNANTVDKYQLSQTTAYAYDVNGNLVSRTNAGSSANNLTGISYNFLNLPNSLTAGGNTISYTYDATGNKLKKLVSGTTNVNNEYISGIQYEGGVLKYMQTAEGRVVRNSATSYSYEYTLADHLGNGRLYFDINAGGTARQVQEVDYYAFGLDIQRMLSGTENKFQYNGKEKQDQEKMYDYGARFYDPVIGRWNVIDPLAENDRRWTPYRYGYNNPLRFIDPDGMLEDWYQSEDGTVIKWVDGDGSLEGYNSLGASNVVRTINKSTGETIGVINLNDDGSATNAETGEYVTASVSGKTKIEADLEASSIRFQNEIGQSLNMTMLKSVADRTYSRLMGALFPVASTPDLPDIDLPDLNSSNQRTDVQFGNPNDDNQVRHANRYLEEAGMDIQRVKNAILKDLKPIGAYKVRQGIKGTVEIGGVTVKYSGMKLTESKINIGTIQPPYK